MTFKTGEVYIIADIGSKPNDALDLKGAEILITKSGSTEPGDKAAFAIALIKSDKSGYINEADAHRFVKVREAAEIEKLIYDIK
jgi:hypothetical protein